jgi:hypothetical protein
VGDESFQAENGDVEFSSVDADTGATTTFTQNKRIYYYEGSVLPIEWTLQHGCGGNSKINCEVVLQYACEDTLDPRVDDFWPWTTNKGDSSTTYYGKQHYRNGGDHIAAPRDGVPRDSDDAATNTIPENEASAIPNTKETRRFGMHENYDYYELCQRTERNKGLYTADQLVRRTDRRGTYSVLCSSFMFLFVISLSLSLSRSIAACLHSLTPYNMNLIISPLPRINHHQHNTCITCHLTGTRQNPNGNRHGFECPEERDYYPWWAPSPWIDIAVLTDEAQTDRVCYPSTAQGRCSKRCQYYMNNTMNFNDKGYCDPNHASGTVAQKTGSPAWNGRKWYNNKEACVAAGFNWYEVKHSDNIVMNATTGFVCAHTQYTRTNQLGNADADTIVTSQNEKNLPRNAAADDHGLNANRFLWTVPDIPTVVASDSTDYIPDIEEAYRSCVLRIRYNISTGDFQQWSEDALDGYRTAGTMVDSRNSSAYEGDPKTPLQQDPYVYIGPGDLEAKGDKFLAMAVNTNQYGRTFQDRSYVFTIRKLPTADAEASTKLDTPEVDWTSMQANLNAGGRIYNVNVRGKRGNIVQTYPSVEYDFVPNSLALGTNDMIHFQWTGSDYNPRRGCNNGEGGPPDANAFSTDANAATNPRADRSNLVFTQTMSHNMPRDYTGYDTDSTTLSFSDKTTTAQSTTLTDMPCYDASTDTTATATQCYDMVMRLAHLNQQLDGGSLVLRGGKDCLTLAELNTLAATNRDVAEYHPLNCAKINAKPHPYYDAGIMLLKKTGLYSYFSSRNNNFSNRQQIGVLCVGTQCSVDDVGRVSWGGPDPDVSASAKSASYCVDKSMVDGEANANGASSCMGGSASSPTDVDGEALVGSTEAVNESDNDFKGEGNPNGCAPQSNYADETNIYNTGLSVEEQIGLAIGLVAAGIFISWLGWVIFRRYNPRKRKDDDWLRRNSTASGSYGRVSSAGEDWTKSPPSRAASPAAAMPTRPPRQTRPPMQQQQQQQQQQMGMGMPPPAPAAATNTAEARGRPVSARPTAEDFYGSGSGNRDSAFGMEMGGAVRAVSGAGGGGNPFAPSAAVQQQQQQQQQPPPPRESKVPKSSKPSKSSSGSSSGSSGNSDPFGSVPVDAFGPAPSPAAPRAAARGPAASNERRRQKKADRMDFL